MTLDTIVFHSWKLDLGNFPYKVQAGSYLYYLCVPPYYRKGCRDNLKQQDQYLVLLSYVFSYHCYADDTLSYPSTCQTPPTPSVNTSVSLDYMFKLYRVNKQNWKFIY